MSMIEHVWQKARLNRKRIVLPEGEEPRTVQAAATKAWPSRFSWGTLRRSAPLRRKPGRT